LYLEYLDQVYQAMTCSACAKRLHFSANTKYLAKLAAVLHRELAQVLANPLHAVKNCIPDQANTTLPGLLASSVDN
jgi:hypothetical protein